LSEILTNHRTDRNGTPTVAAGGIQALFEEADSDALLLYDCCHSAHPAITVSGHGVTEVIAASGFETQTPMPGRTSFTHALIRALIESCRAPPLSVAKLHEMILRSLKSSTRDYLKNDHGEVWTDPHGRPVLQRQPTSTPIHCFLTEERPHRGILLSPLPVRLHQPAGSIHSTDSYKTSSTHLSDNGSTSVSQVSSATDVFDVNPITSTNVLLSIRLDKDYFREEMEENLLVWREWIRNIPPEAKGVKVEAIYESFSTLVLLSIPVTLWNLLPDNPAYSFIGFITSSNKARAFEQEAEAAAERKVTDTGRKDTQTTRDGYDQHCISSKSNDDLLPTISHDERDWTSGQPNEWTEPRKEKRIWANRVNTLSARSPSPDPKSCWSVGGLLQAVATVWDDEIVGDDDPKTTFIHDIEIILVYLNQLIELENQSQGGLNLGKLYQSTLTRSATLMKNHKILAQVFAIQCPKEVPVRSRWSSFTKSALFQEELSHPPEHLEAMKLRKALGRYVDIATLKTSSQTGNAQRGLAATEGDVVEKLAELQLIRRVEPSSLSIILYAFTYLFPQ
jgi:hypothetical protein